MLKRGRVFLLLMLMFVSLSGEDVTDAETLATQKTQEAFVQVSYVTENAARVMSTLSEMQELLEKSESVEAMQNNIAPYCNSIDILLENENYKNIEIQNVRELQKMSSELSSYEKQLVEWEELVKENVITYDTNRKLLQKEIEIWKRTDANAKKESAPETLLEHISSVIKDTQTLESRFKKHYDLSLTNSQLLTSQLFKLHKIDETLKETEQIASNMVFYQNQEPFLELLGDEEFHFTAYIKNIFKTVDEKYNESKEYLSTNSDLWLNFFIVAFLALFFTAYYYKLYRKKELFVKEASLDKKIFFFIGRPFATYILLFILVFVFIFPSRPSSFVGFLSLALVLPVIRVLQTVMERQFHKYIYAFFVAYITLWLNENAVDFELESRLFMLVMSVVLLSLSFRALYKKRVNEFSNENIRKILHSLLIVIAILLFISIFANMYGSVLLSSRILGSLLEIIFVAQIFYVLYVVLTGYIVVIFRRRIATASNMLDIYAQKIETTTKLLIKIWMFAWWLLIVAKTVSLYPLLVDLKESILTFTFHISQTTVSIQGIVDFILIVTGTWILARLTRIVLEVEVFSRFKLPRGAPTAILTTLNYIIIITGTIIAFSSLGVSPQQFALVFGALGVGIGFGLRNIIANFVSGIIMVFERPIQIGDTIEVENTMGSVQSIGARSSTVKTFDGSEVIIPNADFIAKEIINWTLSDEHRRKTVEFKVDLDNDIEAILKIMEEVATVHSDVLEDPKPLATFKSFGEYYLEFKLYFWLSDNLIVAHSEVTIALYKALHDAGVKMPVKSFRNHPEL